MLQLPASANSYQRNRLSYAASGACFQICTENQLPADGLTGDHFRNVDSDGDGKVIEKGYTSFVNRQEELQKHIVCLELDGSGQSLFRIVDSSGDGRLDTSELATLPSRILEMDSNSDSVITEDELPGGFRVILSGSNCR